MVKWQAGIDYFDQGYDQDAVNSFNAFVLNPQVGFPVSMHSPEASIDSNGFGLFGRATITFNDKADLTAGLRFDHEKSDAHLNTFFSPAFLPANVVTADQSFDDVSPQFAFGYRVNPQHTAYVSVARGYKAGGFIRRRCPAARPTAKSTRGTSRAAGNPRSPAASRRQCGRLLHQLGRYAAERPESVRAGSVLHRQRRQCEQQRRRVRSHGAAARRSRCVRVAGIHQCGVR
jgi:hypothetical protein